MNGQKCPECGGDGKVFHKTGVTQGQDYGPEIDGHDVICPKCKGTGKKEGGCITEFHVRPATGQGWAVPKEIEIVCHYHKPNELKGFIESDTLQSLASRAESEDGIVIDALRFFLNSIVIGDDKLEVRVCDDKTLVIRRKR